MFGFSFAKLLVTAVAILVVWYGFKYMNRVAEIRAGKVAARGAAGAAKTTTAKEHRIEAEDLVECKVCGAFVAPASAADCGRDGCPYPA